MTTLAPAKSSARPAKWTPVLGVAMGLMAALIVISQSGQKISAAKSSGPMMSECDGAITAVAIQYVCGADFAVPIYRQFLRQSPADVKVYVACPDQKAFDELQHSLGAIPQTLVPVLTHHAMTAWSRDRWAALLPVHPNGATTLLSSRNEDGVSVWPAREGDQQIAGELATTVGARFTSTRSNFFFDGGDFLADDQTVFVTPAVLSRNIQHTSVNRESLAADLEKLLQRRVVLLDNAPNHHAGMFMMAAGNRTVVVGDPSLAKGMAYPQLPGGGDFTPATQAKFDFVAKAAQDIGYRVVRIPTVVSPDQKTYITYVNGIIDTRGGHRTIYLPQFKGAEALNLAGQKVWSDLDYDVKLVDVTTAYQWFGTLHCLVNVLAKS